MTAGERLYWCGVVFGVGLGLGSFLAECPWDTCFYPSLTGSHPQQIYGNR